jgi:hypothetical protein
MALWQSVAVPPPTRDRRCFRPWPRLRLYGDPGMAPLVNLPQFGGTVGHFGRYPALMRHPTTIFIRRRTVPVDDDPTPNAEGEQGPLKPIPIDELGDEKQWREETGRAKELVQAMHRRK